MAPPSRRAVVLAAAILAAPGAVQARPARHHHAGAAATDTDRVLTRMAAKDRLTLWPAWEERRPFASHFAPATRERVAAPPYTGWGYGGTIPGAWPSFE